jgi:hypothetical protein
MKKFTRLAVTLLVPCAIALDVVPISSMMQAANMGLPNTSVAMAAEKDGDRLVGERRPVKSKKKTCQPDKKGGKFVQGQHQNQCKAPKPKTSKKKSKDGDIISKLKPIIELFK